MRYSSAPLLSAILLATAGPGWRGTSPPRPTGWHGRTDNGTIRRRVSDQAGGFETVTFPASDSLLVTADLYRARSDHAPMILLFHQSGSSRGEYRSIAPRLVALGFQCLAADTRWGDKDRWAGITNETAKRFGTAAIVASQDEGQRRKVRFAARRDLDAALAWARAHQSPSRVIVWGSSWSSILVLDLAREHRDDVNGVVSFSPGEYDAPDRPALVRDWAAAVKQPTYVVSGAAEDSSVAPIYQALRMPSKAYYHAQRGIHGSSILLEEPEAWEPLIAFLRQFLSAHAG
jgi:dienelactone hydrolase